MNLIYKNQSIMTTSTNNPTILKYHFQKLYYAIIINNCNRYSSIANKQRIDVVMTDDKFKIISIKKGMHENTFFEDKNASKTILLPLNYFNNLEINTTIELKEIIKEKTTKKK